MTPYDPAKHHRRSVRLQGYDYAQGGACFVTICTRDRRCVFGDIVGSGMQLNDVGRIARECLSEVPDRFPGVGLDEHVIMPNHLHAILLLVGAQLIAPRGPHRMPAEDPAEAGQSLATSPPPSPAGGCWPPARCRGSGRPL